MTRVEECKDKSPTNEEIVDGLMNDFKESCEINSEGRSGDGPNEEEVKLEAGSSSFLEDDEIQESNRQTKREDFIDEDELKQKELTLTEEDKQRLKSESEELKQKGNALFKSKEFKSSIECYTLGLRTCPLAYTKERAVLYANRAAAKINLSDNEPALEDCNKAIELDPVYIRALLRRAQLQETMDRLDESLEDFKKIMELDPSNKEAIIACQRLPPLINERNEKMKTEMFGKLKELGNVFLRPFGLSTENFQMVQDPATGGYSVKFQQNT